MSTTPSIWLVVILGMASIVARAEESNNFDDASLYEVQPLSSDELSRTIYLNSSGLAYGVAAIAVVVLVAAVGLYLYDYYYGTARTDPIPNYAADKYYQQYYQDQAQNGEYAYADQAQYYRRSNDNSPWEGINILQWIQVLQDMYQNFDYNDLDCQKRMICEVMKEPEYYGNVARKFKNGFQYAKYLELMNLPDEMRELLDEYLDANARSDQQKDCAEFFQCPFSIHDTMKRSEPTNSILN